MRLLNVAKPMCVTPLAPPENGDVSLHPCQQAHRQSAVTASVRPTQRRRTVEIGRSA
jgi:hypothetical protein